MDGHGNYARFAAMVTTSTAVMYVLTYANTYDAGHVRFSEERLYISMLMGSAMAVVMWLFMRSMYTSRRANAALLLLALVLGGTGYALNRSQVLVDDADWMQAMVPHHSIAILTSERARLDDVRVQELADSITAAQRREIQEMDWLLQDIEENGVADSDEEARDRPVPDFTGRDAGQAAPGAATPEATPEAWGCSFGRAAEPVALLC